MAKKKIDQRIRTLIENNVLLVTTPFLVLIGDHGRDQVVNLHYILSKAQVAVILSPLVLQEGTRDSPVTRRNDSDNLKSRRCSGNAVSRDDSPPLIRLKILELFLSQNRISVTLTTRKVTRSSGTYGMCVLQDFEAITPNLLAKNHWKLSRVVESSFSSSKRLPLKTTLHHVHGLPRRYRTSTRFDTVARLTSVSSSSPRTELPRLTDTLDVVPFSQFSWTDAIRRDESDDLGKMVGSRRNRLNSTLSRRKSRRNTKVPAEGPNRHGSTLDRPCTHPGSKPKPFNPSLPAWHLPAREFA